MNAIKELSNESDAITGMRSLRPKSGVLAIASYGIRIAVERGHLCIEDAVGFERRHGTAISAARPR